MKTKILIVEDDTEIKTLIHFFLEKEGFDLKTSSNGLDALEKVELFKPNLIILDIMIPDLNGFKVAKRIKENSKKYGSPIIFMLTAKSEIEDVLEGYETGGDEYLRKPFDPRELVIRIKKLLSLQNKNDSKHLEYHNIKLYEDRHEVFENDKEVILSNKEFRLLYLLILNKGIVLTREKILNDVWNDNYYPGDRTVDVYIGKIRDKISSLSDKIKTVKGVGYKLKT